MAAAPLDAGLAGGQVGPQRGLEPLQVPPDEDRLVLRYLRQLHPRQLVPPASDVEQALPVPAGEPDDPFRPDHLPGEPAEQAFESHLIQRPFRAVDEALEAVGMQMARSSLPCALAEG